MTVTTSYRRVATSTLNGVACSANSNCITITVNNLTPGSIAADQTICSGGDPAGFTSVAATGSGTITYQWQSSMTGCNGTFSNIAGATIATYDVPSGLTVTTSYRRVATSTLNGVACSANSNCITVTVHDLTPGSIAADQTICSGGDPAGFTSVAATGSGTITYQWQSSTTGCNGTFSNIARATSATYHAPSGLTVTTSYRRVATSTLNGVPCSATSNCITLTVNDLTPGSIAADQTICSGGDPAAFTSVAATGSGTITYQWQSSTTGCNGTFSNIAGATLATYDVPSGLTVTTSYRRVATSTLNGVACSANSNCITVTVNDLTPGSIAADQTICSGGDPAGFTSVAATGSGTITYQWQSSTTRCNGTFSNIAGATLATYDVPSGLTVTTSYRRVATSTLNGVACSANSNCITVTVNDLTPGSIAADQTICSGGDPAGFTSVAATGSGTITYQWQSSTTGCNGTFSNIAGATLATYDVPSGLTVTTSYRRVATSTLNGVACSANSNCITVTVNDLTPGSIAADQTICSGGDPAAFTSVAATGSGTITYQWQSSTTGCNGTFSNIAGATLATYDVPSGLTVTTSYRRVATSTLNGVACSANSNCITVTVNNLTPGSIAADQTICSGGDPAGFTSVAATGSGTISYQWQSSTTGCNGTFSNIAGATLATYDVPSGLTVTTSYRRVATSTLNGVACSANSNCITVTVNDLTPGSIAADQTICSGGDPAGFTSVAATGSGTITYQWQSSTTGCNGTFSNIAGATLATYDVPSGLTVTTSYRRVATSTLNGVACSANSNCITITVNNLTPGSIAADQTICSGGDPAGFTSVAATGSGTITYQWQSSTTGCNGTFSNIAGATIATYDVPSGLTVTTSYRRVATSTLNGVACSANSNCITVTVNDLTPGSIAADQTICSGGDPAGFTSVAATGSGTITYQWQSSTTGCNGTFSNIAGATLATYDVPSGLTVTTSYRRVATSTLNGVTCSANSNCITVTVNDLTPGSIAADQTICSGGDPAGFTSVAATGSGTITYQWQSSTTGCNGTFSNIAGATLATYDVPSGLTVTTSYRRVATSTLNGVACSANSNCITVTVNNLTPGSIAADQTICSGGDPAAFTSVAATGSGTITYQWKSSTTGCNGTFSNIAGATLATYDVPSGLTVTTSYRRVATSTLNGVACSANSNCITVTVNNLTPGSIAADQTICSGGDPAGFTSAAATGSGTITYQWQSSTTGCNGTFSNIAGATLATYDVPSGLTVTTSYRRVATSTLNGVACTANSNCITVTVNDLTPGSIAADQTICSGGDPAAFTSVAATGSGTITYQWQSSTTGCNGTFSNIAGATLATYDVPSGLTVTTSYRRVATSTLNGVACSANSNCITVTVNDLTPGSIAADQTICSGGDPAAFTSVAATGSGTITYQWQSSTTGCNGTFSNIAGATLATYDVPSGLTVTTSYRRVATSTLNGVACSANSNCITVTVNNLTPGSIAADQTICSGGDPAGFTSVAATGSGTITYQWQSSTTGCNGTFSNIAGATSAIYDVPSGLTVTTSYRRVATSTLNGVACSANSNCITVTVNDLTPGSIAADQTICSGGDPAGFTSVAATGSGTITYQWQSSTTGCNGTFSNIAGATLATYDVPSGLTVTTSYRRVATSTLNGVACSANSNCITLTVVPNPVVTITGGNKICAGTSSTFTANPSVGTAPFTYLWSTTATTQSINVSTAGTYSVTVTDANGCTGTASRTLTVDPNPVVTITGGNKICAGTSSTFTANASVGTAPFTYLWSTTATTQSINVSTAGTYSVTVTDANGCTGTASRTLTVDPNPVVTITGGNKICAGTSSTFTANASVGTAPFTYLWSTTATTQSINVSTAGTYSVTVTDANGCTGTASRTLTVDPNPVITITGDNKICAGTSSTFTANASVGTAPFTYLWSTTATTQSINVSAAGTYSVTVTDANGCTGTASRTLTVDPNPVVTITGGNKICAGTSSTFTANASVGTAPFTYLWSTTATTQSINVSTAGTYSVTVTDANGCTGTASRTLTVDPNPVVTITGGNKICAGTSSTFTANASVGTAPFTYLWSTTATTQSINVSTAGTYSVTVTDANGCTGTASRTLTVDPNPVVTITGDNKICAGTSSTFTANASVGTAPFTYLWSTTATTQSINVSTAGTYSVTVTDANGCTGTASRTLTVDPNPVVTITGDNKTCTGTSSTFTANASVGTAPFTYLWSTTATTQSINVSTAGTYSVTVTDANGCTGTASRILTVDPNPVVTITGDNKTCTGTSSTFTANASVGTAPFTYLWSTTATTQSINVSTAGTYSVTVTDANGCTGTASRTLTVDPNPVVTITGDNKICAGTSSTFTANASVGTAPFTYLWSTTATTQSINVSTAGTYSVTVTDANGCTGTASRTLTVDPNPVVTITGGNKICAGTSSTFTANASVGTAPFTYLWSTTATTQSINVSTAGTYSVTVTDANGCTGTASRTLTVDPNPVVTITGDNKICSGTSSTFTANASVGTAPFTYLWSTTATTQSINVSTAGTYSVTVTDANGCTGTASRTLTVDPNPVVTITGDNKICAGTSSTFTANASLGTAPFTYLWSTTATTQSINVSTAGTYSVTVTDANGCTGTASRTLTVDPNPVVTITGDNKICAGTSSTFTANASVGTAPFTYLWSTTATTQSINVSTAGTYSVTVTDANGCTGTASRTLTVDPNPVVTITGGNKICSGTSSTFTANASVGTAPFTYLWSTTATTQSINVSTAGTYSVTVTDANGCTGTASRTLTVDPNPVVTITGDNKTCTGTSSKFTANASVGTAPFTYLWSTTATTQSINVSTAGTYSVTVTDANGCTGTASRTLTVDPNPVVTITGGNKICAGTSSTFTANPSVGTAPFTYLWSTTATTQSINVSKAGTYSVTVTDANGCTGTASRTLTVDPNPVVTITGGNKICAGTSSTFTANPSVGTAPFTYLWSTTATTQSINVSTAGTYSVTVTDANGCTGTASRTLTVDPNPVVTITGDNKICAGTSSTFTANASVGTAPFTYLWSTTATTQSINVSTAGTYSVTVTDANGCTGTASRTLTVDPNPVVTITGDNKICAGTSSTFTANASVGTAPFTYLWSTTATTQSINVSTAGTYSVTVTDANGCTGTASRTLTVDPNPVVTITGGNKICAGTSSTFTANPSVGTAPFTYLWSTTATTQSINVSTAGTYSVTVTDANGCTGTASRTLTVDPNPVVTITGDNKICAGTSSTFTANASVGTAPFTYLWSTTATTQSINVSTAGTYSVTVTDANGCTGTASRTLTVDPNPVVTITGGNKICAGTSSTFTANASVGTAPFTYLWSTTATTQSINVSTAGTYSVTVTDANGCTGTASRTLTVDPNPVVTITGDNKICAGTSSTFTANASVGTAPFTYLWSTIATTQSINVSTAGTYSVTVTDANGCTGTASRTLTVDPNPVVTITGDNKICAGTSSTFTANASVGTAPFTYLWSTTATTQSINVSTAGTYSVTVTDANGCTGTANRTLTVDPNPVVTITGGNKICAGTSSTFTANPSVGTAPFTYLWSTTATTQSINVSTAGTYSVTVTDANGCTGTASRTLTVDPNPVVTITGDNKTCTGTSSTFTANASVGTAPFTYLWSTTATTQSINVSTAGTYSVTVTDANGCTGTASRTLTVDPNPVVTITGDNKICAGTSSTFTANASVGTAPFTYLWSTTATTQSINVSTAGTYSVTVTDANGCTGTASRTLTVDPNPVVTITGGNKICTGTSSTFTANASVGTAPFTYLWSTTATTQSINVSTAGTYSVTVTDANGCTGTASRTLTVDPNPVVTITGDNKICAGTSSTFTANASVGTAPFTYLWSTTATTQSINVSAAGTYSVTVTDANGCTGTASRTLTVDPKIKIGDFVWLDSNGDGCQDFAELGLNGVTVRLFDASNVLIDTKVTTNNSNGAPGYYEFEVCAGTYYVNFSKPSANHVFTKRKSCGNNTTDSDPNTTTGNTDLITLTPGQQDFNLDAGFYLPARLGDYVWIDANGNGIQDGIEVGLNGVNVILKDVFGVPITSTITATGGPNNLPGYYQFTNLAPGSYIVMFVRPSGYDLTKKDASGSNDTNDSDADPTTGNAPVVTLVSGESNQTIDAGLYRTSSLGDFVWHDLDKDGRQDANEPGLNGFTVTLFDINGVQRGQKLTANNPNTGLPGWYEFINLVPDTYYISVTPIANQGWTSTIPNVGNEIADSDISGLHGANTSDNVPLASGQNYPDLDAGYYLNNSLGDYVWEDSDRNGAQDANEQGINGINVMLFNSITNVMVSQKNTTTNPLTGLPGWYLFDNLATGTYYVKFTVPVGYLVTSPNQVGDAIDSDLDNTNGLGTTGNYTINANTNNLTVDAGLFKAVKIGNFVWKDTGLGNDGKGPEAFNGVQDPGERPVPGAIVNLKNVSGVTLQTTTTDNLGEYYFYVAPNSGSYTLQFLVADTFNFTTPNYNANLDDIFDSDVTAQVKVSPYMSGTTQVFVVGAVDNLTYDAGIYPQSILPLTLISFNGYLEKDHTALNWITAVEENTDRFIIERKHASQSSFKSIGSVKAQGNSTVAKSYDFLDYDIKLSGVYYYRLKMLDKDGSFTYSNVVSVVVNSKSANTSMTVYPNPTREVININLNGLDKGDVQFSIVDLDGKIILNHEHTFKSTDLNHDLQIDIRNIPTGIYLLKMNIKDNILTEKIMITR
ncbi:MAG: T9SS type A sorting domain-containing protein [Saprospiraceae bacterium]|nr:T9SS type A sorting domain-containing protein [Candidatus Defluviibacterium haderslevense]